jgi:lipopolysaccharide/colanic/teichoic acid biosynthesis glycosyltransferase
MIAVENFEFDAARVQAATRRRGAAWMPGRRGARILSEEAFGCVLERERGLADRTDRAFSLVVFEAPADAAARLAPVLAQCVRQCDLAGWIDRERLGVILSDTPREGSLRLTADVRARLNGDGHRVTCRVLSYPGEDLPSARQTGADPEEAGLRDKLLLPGIPGWKRLMDIAGSAAALALLSPLMLAVAALIRLVSPGPVFFKQERVGRGGRRFVCWKFRTMRTDADARVHAAHVTELIRSGGRLTKLDCAADPRLIPCAHLLRSSGLDELPQLLNVLRGEMSLVGPRPCTPYEYENFRRWHKQRFDVLPGLTGLWQVSGKNRTTFTEMMRLDVRYARRIAPARDAAILLRTIPAVAVQILELRKSIAMTPRSIGATSPLPTMS